jgi:membrane peptidoglycan carboxypeptidase
MHKLRRGRYFLLAALVVGCIAGWLAVSAFLGDVPDPGQTPARASTPSILITDRQGRVLYEVIDPKGSKYLPLPLDRIPVACRQATIATEDSHFYTHPGVDPIAVARAVWLNWRGGRTVSGGSTLTQQLARNLYLGTDERTERSLRRKLREAWLAWRLERKYGKDQLLALYMNTTYYGHFATGIEAAAQAYFGSHANELDLAQCALLAGLPQYPAGYNPIENLEAARARQSTVLDLMVKNGYISTDQAGEARNERLAFAATPFPIEAPHFVMWVQTQLETLLPAERLQAGGLRVTTTLDLDWQHQAEAAVTRRLAQLHACANGVTESCDPGASPQRRVDDAALVAMDPGDGAVRAMVGSADYFDPSISGAVNAALSLRQPGSAIKPLTYAAAFDPVRAVRAGQQPWTPATLIADVRTVFPTDEGRPYVPVNYDMRYHGPVLARDALANSYNIPAVKALQYIGLPALIEQANRLGIGWGPGQASLLAPSAARTDTPAGSPASDETSAQDSRAGTRFGLSLTLGGGEVRLLDLTAAYAAFANGGKRVTPYAIARIETLDGQVLLDTNRAARPGEVSIAPAESTHPAPLQVLDPRVAYLITDILSDTEARIPSFGQGNVLELDRPAAAKTGTTTDWRDNWTLGYVPSLVTGVWAGNADNTPMVDVSGIAGAGPIWHDFMLDVLKGSPAEDFVRPDGLVRVEVCADSGRIPLPVDRTGQGGTIPCPSRRPEWFISGTEPTEVDYMHQRVDIDVRTGAPAAPGTPPEAIRTESYWLLPDEYQDWARANNIPQPSGAGRLAAAAGPATVSEGIELAPEASLPAPASGSTEVAQKQAGPGPTGRSSARGPVGAQAIPPLALISPEPNQTYRLDPGLPAGAQQVPVVARPASDLAATGLTITLLIDGAPLGTVSGPDYTAWWQLAPGRHTFKAVARSVSGAEVHSLPVAITVQR